MEVSQTAYQFLSLETKLYYMEKELLPIDEIVDLSEEYLDELENLEQRIDNRDIPSWILVPKRSSGENPTGHAWLGLVMARCGENEGIIDTRVAIDTEERGAAKSKVGKVPEPILNTVNRAQESTTKDSDICIARMEYDTSSMNLQSVNLHLRLEEDEKDEDD